MSLSNVIRMAAAKCGMNQARLAEACGVSQHAMNNKFFRDTWKASDLIRIAEATGGKLAIIYPDGQQILFLPEELSAEEK